MKSNSVNRNISRFYRKLSTELETDLELDPIQAANMNECLKIMLARKHIESYYYDKELNNG